MGRFLYESINRKFRLMFGILAPSFSVRIIDFHAIIQPENAPLILVFVFPVYSLEATQKHPLVSPFLRFGNFILHQSCLNVLFLFNELGTMKYVVERSADNIRRVSLEIPT